MKRYNLTLFFIGIIPIIFAIVYLYLNPFDGIEFNGDSFRYYQSGVRILQSFDTWTFPAPSFWPDGYPLLIGLIFKLTHSTFFNAQLINIVLIPLIFVLLYITFNKTNETQSGHSLPFTLTVLLTYFSGFILKYQLTIMSDVPALFWSVLTTCFLFLYLKKRTFVFIVLIAFSFAFAVMTRYVYAILIIPVCLTIWYELKSFKPTAIVISMILFFTCLFSLPQLILIAQSPDSSLNHPWLQNWSVSNFVVMDRSSVDGFLSVQFPNVIYYLLIPFKTAEFTVLGFFIFIFGIGVSFKKKPATLSVFFLLWFLSFYLFLSGILIQNPRFSLSLYIPIFYFSYHAISYGVQSAFKPVIYTTLTVLIIIKCFLAVSFLNKTIDEKNVMYKNASAFSAVIPQTSIIITWDFFEVYHIYFPNRKVETIHGLTEDKVHNILQNYPSAALIFDEQRLERTWKNRDPERLYRWIQQTYPFKQIYDDGKYKIWLSDKK